VIEAARRKLIELETDNAAHRDYDNPAHQMALSLPPPPDVPVVVELRQLDPDSLTPRGALELVYYLKGLLASE
jgi:DNA mismatch repair protein MutS